MAFRREATPNAAPERDPSEVLPTRLMSEDWQNWGAGQLSDRYREVIELRYFGEPMPRAPPVTSTTLLLRFSSIKAGA